MLFALFPFGGVLFFLGLSRREAWLAYAGAVALALSLALVLSIQIRRSYGTQLGMPRESVVALEGRVVYDSSFTQSGNHLMKVSLSRCTSAHGDVGTANGVVAAVGKESRIVSSGIEVLLAGSFEDGLFVYDELQVLERSAVNDFREALIVRLMKRMLGEGTDEASLLSIQLLLGRSEEGGLDLREKAQRCGCSHVLALSGMHLNVLVALCSLAKGRRKALKIITRGFSDLVVASFLFVAGPRPSLVRAALSYALAGVPLRERSLLVFLLQMALFPYTMMEAGCCYGYLAFFAIVHLSPYVDAMLSQYVGRLSELVSTSLSVLVYSVPFQMLNYGRWSPAVVLASPVLGVLAALSMVMGILLLAFGRLGAIVWANGLVYRAMDRSLGLFGEVPSLGWVGYGVVLALVALLLALNILDRRLSRIFNCLP